MSDIGLHLVNSLYQQLMIDDQWALRRERGFTWWSYRLAQHVEVSPPFMSQGTEVCRVRMWTETVGAVDPNLDPARVVAAFNTHATLDALVWDPERAMLNRCSTGVVHAENFVWLSEVLATAAILQNAAAHNQAQELARMLNGEPAASNHPRSGVRPVGDGILDVPSQVVIREGAYGSRFAGPRMADLGGFLVEMRFLGSADEENLTCEVPYTQNEPVSVTCRGTSLHRTQWWTSLSTHGLRAAGSVADSCAQLRGSHRQPRSLRRLLPHAISDHRAPRRPNTATCPNRAPNDRASSSVRPNTARLSSL
ncbi:hypothetical protein KTR9_2443 [Gordonia sp. KTR9]|nr:hypothetical protein KTR9_2443 [Gordonia sp. KTR9]